MIRLISLMLMSALIGCSDGFERDENGPKMLYSDIFRDVYIDGELCGIKPIKVQIYLRTPIILEDYVAGKLSGNRISFYLQSFRLNMNSSHKHCLFEGEHLAQVIYIYKGEIAAEFPVELSQPRRWVDRDKTDPKAPVFLKNMRTIRMVANNRGQAGVEYLVGSVAREYELMNKQAEFSDYMLGVTRKIMNSKKFQKYENSLYAD